MEPRHISITFWLCSILFGIGFSLTPKGWATAQATPPKKVMYNSPPRDYELRKIKHGKVFVEAQLLQEEPELAKRALKRLEVNRLKALQLLPPHTRARLQKLPFYLLYGSKAKGGGYDSGLEYIQPTSPDFHPNYDSRWRSVIVIFSASNYTRISDFWALKVMIHEFAHAHQLEQFPETQDDIMRAWQEAMKLRLYHDIENDRRQKLAKAYAATNQLEYFAELSSVYFVGAEYFPFTRHVLEIYDPVGYGMVEKMWGLKKDQTDSKNSTAVR